MKSKQADLRHLSDDALISALSPDRFRSTLFQVVLGQSGLETHKSHVEIGGVRFDFLDHKVFSTLR